jgi:hypothetical protein
MDYLHLARTKEQLGHLCTLMLLSHKGPLQQVNIEENIFKMPPDIRVL